ncbi:hypothetical protein R3P38DRAFT_3199277 [Favolaschia claudopus]|uniref:Uncharacterized protein n=1 Tax=Favolaschia claudopus TaxID=2862362 RepID=A0AAW0B482_9AGAR
MRTRSSSSRTRAIHPHRVLVSDGALLIIIPADALIFIADARHSSSSRARHRCTAHHLLIGTQLIYHLSLVIRHSCAAGRPGPRSPIFYPPSAAASSSFKTGGSLPSPAVRPRRCAPPYRLSTSIHPRFLILIRTKLFPVPHTSHLIFFPARKNFNIALQPSRQGDKAGSTEIALSRLRGKFLRISPPNLDSLSDITLNGDFSVETVNCQGHVPLRDCPVFTSQILIDHPGCIRCLINGAHLPLHFRFSNAI